jgi:AcrR family transcriptional regulator
MRQEECIESSGRLRIVAAARYHFFAYGFRSVTMDDLARELGMSKKTLYTHFPNKSALVEAVLMNKIHDIEKELQLITSDSGSDFPVVLHQILARIQSHLEEIQPPFLRDLQRETPEVFRLVETRRKDIIHQYFGKLMDEGRRAGLLRPDVPTKLIVEMFLGIVQAIMNPEKLSELGLSPKEGFAAIITVVLEGVITVPGRATL